MRRINYKSDFDFILPFPVYERQENGSFKLTNLDWPEFDWEACFWTWSKSNAYIVSRKGSVLRGCYNDNGRIHVVCSDHQLGKGKLQIELRAMLPDDIYPNSLRKAVGPYSLNLDLVPGVGDCCGFVGELAVIAPDVDDNASSPSETVEGEAFTFEEIDELIDSIGDKYTPTEGGDVPST